MKLRFHSTGAVGCTCTGYIGLWVRFSFNRKRRCFIFLLLETVVVIWEVFKLLCSFVELDNKATGQRKVEVESNKYEVYGFSSNNTT